MKRQIMKTVALTVLLLATNLYVSAGWQQCDRAYGVIKKEDQQDRMSFNDVLNVADKKEIGLNKEHEGYRQCVDYDFHSAGQDMGVCFTIYKYTLYVEPHAVTKVKLSFDIIAGLWDTNINQVYSFAEIASIDGTLENVKAQKLWVNPKSEYSQKDPYIVCDVQCHNNWKNIVAGDAEVTFDNRNGSDRKEFERYFIMVFSSHPDNYCCGHSYAGMKNDPTIGTPTIEYALEGDGSKNNPFKIKDANELVIFRNMVNNGNNPNFSASLTADIDMSGVNWLPIGRHTEDSQCRVGYTGTFDGNGHTISNLSGNSDNDHDMALIGRAESGCTVKRLLMENVSMKAKLRAASIIGLADGNVIIENCGTHGNLQISSTQGWGYRTDGIANGGNISLKDCYTTWPAALEGANNGEYRPTNVTNTYYGNEIKNMVKGELCYKLNHNSSIAPTWYQNLKTMDYPVLDNREKAVHKTGDIYHNGALQFDGTGSQDDPFILTSDKDLLTFKDLVDQGCTDICASLAADIDYTAHKGDTAMIGSETNQYKGVFNGNGKSIKIDFSTNKNEAGLFRYVDGATIGNLHLTGSIQGDGRIVGSLIGTSYGNTQVTHVISDVAVTSNFSGDAANSGLVAGAHGSLSIDYSAFRGSLLGTSTNSCGGFVGWIYDNSHTDITNSYFAPENVTWGSDGASSTFARDRSGERHTITNCYYTKQFGEAQGEMLTTDQMKSGEGCCKLNGSSNNKAVWLQTLGQDELPTLWSSKRVYQWSDNLYSNAECELPGAGTQADPLLIGSATELEYFRDLVNDYNLHSLCARLTADIDMRDRDWIPIGRWTTDEATPKVQVAYTGTFDGDGYVISNLSGSSEVDYHMGLIGRGGEGCAVMSLIMDNVHLKSYNNCAPIIGYTTNTCTVEYCGVTGVVKMEIYGNTGYRDGIIADENKCVSMKGCYTVFESMRPYTTTDDETNHNYCNVGSKAMTASGELCYKLNGNDGKSHRWLQTIGKDTYPMQRTGGKVGMKDGKYANISFTDADNYVFNGKLGSSDLKIIHHGGHLYEFVVTLGTKDGLGHHRFPDMKLYYKENGSWIDIATLKNINREALSFEKDWSGEITISKGTFINSHTYEAQTPVFWIMQGNHTSKKAASLLWLAPDGMTILPTEFKVESVNASPTLVMSNGITKTEAPTGANAVTIVGPYINTLATGIPGSAATMIVSPNTVYSLGVWDATDDKFISTQEITDGTNKINVTLPQQERVHELVALMYARQVDIVGLEADTTFITYGVPFTQKPLHSIYDTNASSKYNESNTIKWAIAFPNDSDMISNDMFTIHRAYQPDLSDVTTLDFYYIENFTSTTTKGDTLMGWYAYTDSTEEGRTTSVQFDGSQSAFDTWNLEGEAKEILTAYKYPARYIYYGVQRATATAIWNNADKYQNTWKVLLTSVLPKVDTIRVVKSDDYEATHKVELHLTLNNPYPETLVPSTYRQAVSIEAKAHGFTGRMFHWDENANIVITRYCPDDEWYNGVDEVAETITIDGSDVKLDNRTGNYYAVVTDIQSAPYTHYYYKAQVDNTKSAYPICSNMTTPAMTTEAEANACYSETFPVISNFKGTRGADIGIVDLSWDADNATSSSYSLQKSIYDLAYDTTYVVGSNTTNNSLTPGEDKAEDSDAKSGVVYKYDLTRSWKFRGKTRLSKGTTYGWSIYDRGSISGHVTMPDGTAMPGDVYVTVRLKSPRHIVLKQVNNPDATKKDTIFKEFRRDSVVIETKADANGYYKVDNLCYFGTGVQYEVQARCSGATFVSSSGTSSGMTLTLEDANYKYENVDFFCRDTKQFSGRILYEGSTVPVRDMTFKVNGQLLKNKDGKAVTTDAMGNFSFMVPKFEVEIQAFKTGHKLKDEGHILGGTNKDQIKFTPQDDYDGLLLYDQTRVRLVGRVVGGNVEGSKPVGFGKSVNNLGDDITLVLQLEGDNTSYIYYNAQNPEETSKQETFSQKVISKGNTSTIDKTNVTFFSKRIAIEADKATGEFCLDLFPTKYKVSQMSAKGYSTLYREGEGMQVIDLTNGNDAVHYADQDKGEQTSYAAAFNYIYHTEAKVTLAQDEPKNNGWVGDSLINVTTVFGKQSIQTAWKDKDEVHYTFGHPVFQGGKKYTFTASAVEEYHYNNVPTGRLSTSPLANDSLVICNGLTSGNQIIYKTLNSAGKLSFTITPSNTTFSFTGENALFTLSAAAKVNGWSYESEPIKGYVTGYRDMGVGVQAVLNSKPEVLDIIRDPYGSGSYAYRSEGTTYSWSQHYEKTDKVTGNLNISAGLAIISSFGIGYTNGFELDLGNLDLTFNGVTKNKIKYKDGEYTMTINDRIATSSDPLDVGAMADIYIGHISTVDLRKSQVLTVIDNNTHASLSTAEKSGALTTVCRGKDKKGNDQYLIVGQGVSFTGGTERVFIYSQKYIVGTLIPELEKQHDLRLRVTKTKEEAISMADQTGLTYYYMENDTSYQACYPNTSNEKKTVTTDTLKLYKTQIEQWKAVVEKNEKTKYEAMKNTDKANNGLFGAYSITQGTIEHSEEASTFYRTTSLDGPEYLTVNWDIGAGLSPVDKSTRDSSYHDTKEGNSAGDGKKHDRTYGLGLNFEISGGQDIDKSYSNTISNHTIKIGGSGYSLSTSDNSNLDMDVYRINDSSSQAVVNKEFKQYINNYENGNKVDDYKKTDSNYKQLMDDNNSFVHNYIFVQRGGSTRNPWSDADSSLYYKVNGKRVPLGARTLRIDNPKIYVENPIVNNQPQDEPAIFTIRLANETEINENAKYLNPSTLYLNVDEPSNPYGAKLTIDGQPLRNHMEFYLNPGQSAVKTLEVERGGKPYDYENIKLQFTDNPDLWTLCDEATISVHYQPVSSPVNLSMPADNWLMNTLSQKDDDGKYYIPVQIDGFSTTKYDNFDHIELQYKKQTEGEDQWVNLCSYYADKELYNNATGTKAMIKTEGKIEDIRFYGEKDPIEMKYDLRAVSFCRLGTGYVTRYSKVVSGTKDTRCPEVFGKPSPADGILDFDDVISLPFTEPIAYNYLDETVNFSVQGFTNNSDADHSAYIRFPGSSAQEVSTKVTRETEYHDFTVDMMVKVENATADKEVRFFTLGTNANTTNDCIVFGYNPSEDYLVANVGGREYKSVKLSSRGLNLRNVLTHVALTHSAQDSTVKFIVGEEFVPLTDGCMWLKCRSKAAGRIYIGKGLKGAVADIRIWTREFSASDLALKLNKSLSTCEKNLFAYYPMKEAQGNIIYDVTNGADLYLTDVTWQTPTGYSVRLDKKPVVLTKKAMQKFTRNDSEDYTLAFWFRTDAGTSLEKAMLFSAGGDSLSEKGMDKMRIGFIGKELRLVSEGNTLSFGTTDTTFAASVWHHMAVSVNNSLNTVSLFLDGKMVNETSADMVGGIAGSYVAFGDGAFSGNIDNVTLWSMALPASYIHEGYNTDMTGREPELLVNLDFEQQLRNEQGSLYIGFSPLNNVIVKATGNIAGDTLVSENVYPDADRYAPVRAGTGLQNIPFTWTSTDNALQINLKKADADINHQQLNFVVRNVEDVNGNPMKNASMWSVYVNRNVLEWEKSVETINLQYGSDTTIEVTWKNKGGRIISYSIDNESPWLQIDNTFGTMQPLSEASASLTVNDGLSPGSYRTELYLTDEDNLVSKMTLTVNIEAKAPDWEVVSGKYYTSSMQVIACVKKKDASGNWITDMSKKDIVAAFFDNLCIGKASLTIDETANTSYLFLNLHGSAKFDSTKTIEFRLWDASTAQTHILEAGTVSNGVFTKEVMKFRNKSFKGIDNPIEMRATTSKMQTLHLSEGWNWVSLNIRPKVQKGLKGLFSDYGGFKENDVLTRVGYNFSTYEKDGEWSNNFNDMATGPNNVYMIFKRQAGTVSVSGTAFEDGQRTVTLTFNSKNRWSELAYLLDVTQPIGIALSDFPASSDKAPAGTIIMSHECFAVAREDGHWFGSLQYLRPGEGYFVYRSGKDSTTVTISYTNTSVQATTKASIGTSRDGSWAKEEAARAVKAQATGKEYCQSMPVIAAFAEGTWQEGDILVAIVNGDVAGAAEAIIDNRNGKPYFFLSVNASDESVVRFVKVRDGQVVGESRNSLAFNGEQVIGTLDSPYLIDFTETVSEGVYDVTGIKYQDENHLNNRRGVYIINGQKIVK